MTRHEKYFFLAALLLALAGFVSTTPTLFSVALACAGAVAAFLGKRAQVRELGVRG